MATFNNDPDVSTPLDRSCSAPQIIAIEQNVFVGGSLNGASSVGATEDKLLSRLLSPKGILIYFLKQSSSSAPGGKDLGFRLKKKCSTG